MKSTAVMFSPSKVGHHESRIQAYWRGERIFPVTVELDLTQLCTRACPQCPYSASRSPGLTLALPFLERLFSILGPHTPGLILTGGEATFVPHYPETLALARAKGFKEISTITNGTCLHRPAVQNALLEHGTAVRVSLYDWQEEHSPAFLKTLRAIEALRRRIEIQRSPLQIGATLLTRSEWVPRMESTALAALRAGAHWVYFHPFCVDWESERPRMADQTGVVEFVERLRREASSSSAIQLPVARYKDYPLVFPKLHAGHFLLQVGADGVNYAGPECKYEPNYALLDLNEDLKDDFLWHPRRLARLKTINSENYRCIGTRHRPPMFSDYLERTRPGKPPGGSDHHPIFMHPALI